ncbi:thioredoxin family protein [uncultured Flavobacterium sp.]|uniref:thioredoxin family protein n=1 Tax=uncultured Flavobacterium sp. TaxID=165435 RepID=UPI0030EBF224|tara:strand:+ start:147678 stop:148283 length:606 start_codon:yes stop_codon:yes gene_type:complete
MNKNIVNALAKSYTYNAYREIVSKLITEGKSTGNTQTDDLLHYSELNETRMNRLEKTIKITDDVQTQINQLETKVTWLVIAEGWCGDAAQILPIIYKMAESSKNIDLKIVLRDENDDLMNDFLTNGGMAIPKLIILDEENNVIGDFGPRPEPARKLIADYKAANGVVDEPIKVELQKWYLHDKGVSTQNEIMQLMKSKELV